MKAGHDNAYDVVRLALAAAVLYAHAFLAGGFGGSPFERAAPTGMNPGDLAVLGFFGLSGWLIAASFERSRSTYDFLAKRAARILPGFWVCLVVTAFGFGPAIEWARRGSLAGYEWGDAAGYVVSNAALAVRQWSIGDLLTGMPFEGSVNVSLWTLWGEFQCYVGTLVLGRLGGLDRNRRVLLALLAAGFAAYAGSPAGAHQTEGPTYLILGHQLHVYVAYLAGATLYAYRDRVTLGRAAAAASGAACLVAAVAGGFDLLAPLSIPLLVLACGRLGAVPLRHDFSYGLYIYGFPVQQLLAATGAFGSPIALLAASAAGAGLCAVASWFLVERPAIGLARRLLAGRGAAAPAESSLATGRVAVGA